MFAIALLVPGQEHYVLFHSVVEGLAVVVACAVFIVAWNTRAIADSSFLMVLGFAYFAVGAFDSLHLLAYRGVGVIGDASGDTATQLWIAARFMESVALLVGPWFLGRRVHAAWPALTTAAVAALLGAAIFGGLFPVCLRPESGLTPFKIGAEYAVAAVLIGALLHLRSRRAELDPSVYGTLLVAIAVTIVSELAFTLYAGPFGFFNRLGHLLKAVSVYLVYRTTVVTCLANPLQLLFHNLQRQQEQLHQVNRDLEGFAHTVSHDLKGPLATVVSGTEALELLLEKQLGRPPAGGLAKALGAIRRGVRQCVELVDGLLALAAAGQRPTRVEQVRVGEVVHRIVEDLRAEIEQREILLEVDEDLGVLRADPNQIYQIFSNLLRNAIRHTRGNPPRVTVRYEATSSNRHRWLVRDTGPGLPPELEDRLFEPFAKGPEGQHGIGLSIVRRLVAVYDGEVHGFTDGGACFAVSLEDYQA